MRELLSIFFLVLLISFCSVFFPSWWWIMLVPILFGLVFPASVHKSFFLAFLAGLLVWGGFSLFELSRGAELITQRMATLFSLPNGNFMVLVVVIIGGLLAGISAATGSSIRSFFVKPKRKSLDYY